MNIKYIIASIVLLIPFGVQAQVLPEPVTDDLWDVSQEITVISHSAVLNTDHDARDAFGGTFGANYITENGNLIFKDNLPLGTVHSLEWKTEKPIVLDKFRVFAAHDTSRPSNCGCPFPDARVRGFDMFRLYAKNSSGDFTLIHEFDPIRPAGDKYWNNIDGALPNKNESFLYEADISPITGQEFRAEFVQRGDPTDLNQYFQYRTRTGPRIIELDGFGEVAPEGPDPIVIVPGMTVSMNLQKLFLNSDSKPDWDFAPGAENIYRALIERLEGTGYTLGENLFVSHYDWRQSTQESAQEYLKPDIASILDQTGANKVDIIAHSMGGLVSRSYIQGSNYNNDVDQLILLGTPNEGAADAYVAWEGGELPERWGAGLRLYADAIKKVFAIKNNTEAGVIGLRLAFPGLRDLLPINPFVSNNGVLTNIPDLAEQNFFLQGLKTTQDRLDSRGVRVTSIAGTESETLDKVPIDSSPSLFTIILDQLNSRWRDGHPLPNPTLPDSLAGDRTVLLSSAGFEDDVISLPGIVHDALPQGAQNQILETLGLDASSASIAYDLPENMLGVIVLSPINPTITCGDQTLSSAVNTFESAEYVNDPTDPDGPKLLVISNPPQEECVVTLIGTATGDYHVITTYADQHTTVSTERSGSTIEGQEESFSILLHEDGVFVPPSNILAVTESLREFIRQLHEDESINSLIPYVNTLHAFAQAYTNVVNALGLEKSYAKPHYTLLQTSLDAFEESFADAIEKDLLTNDAIKTISLYLEQLNDMGL